MGTRTELFLRVELDEDLPDKVVVILDTYARGEEAGALEELPEQAFSQTPAGTVPCGTGTSQLPQHVNPCSSGLTRSTTQINGGCWCTAAARTPSRRSKSSWTGSCPTRIAHPARSSGTSWKTTGPKPYDSSMPRPHHQTSAHISQ